MTADADTLIEISRVIRTELPKYLSSEFVIHDVTAQNRPGPDAEDYVHVRVILEDDHPRLDPYMMMSFSVEMHDLFEESGIDHSPNITYANRSELS